MTRFQIIFMSGRMEQSRKQTELWLDVQIVSITLISTPVGSRCSCELMMITVPTML